MGSVSQDGLPLFVGRYKDPKTGKIKTMKKQSYLVNPTNWKSKFDKGVLNMAYKWNQFVRAQQAVTNSIKAKNVWAGISSRWKTNASVPMVKRRIMMNLARSIISEKSRVWE